jgi:hypothetical protein
VERDFELGEARKSGAGMAPARRATNGVKPTLDNPLDHQKEAGVFTLVSGLVEEFTDNPAAKLTAQGIAQRVQQAQQQRTAGQTSVAA